MWSRAQTKDWRSLATAAGRRAAASFLVEGVRSLEEASAAGRQPREVVVARGELSPRVERWLAGLPASVPVHHLPESLVARLGQTVSNQGLAARFTLPAPVPIERACAALVVLDGVQDPGNVGTLARHAVAFGVEQLVVLPGTADPFGPKAVRASMGGIFRLRWTRCDSAEEALAALRAAELSPRVLRAEGGENLWSAAQPARLALVLGGEAHGPGPAWAGETAWHIPQSARVESCNAAFAASLVFAFRYGQRGS